VQVLDSSASGRQNNECAASTPTRAVDQHLLPPLVADLLHRLHRAPAYELRRQLTARSYTVKHNGVVVHDKVEIKAPRRRPKGRPEAARSIPSPSNSWAPLVGGGGGGGPRWGGALVRGWGCLCVHWGGGGVRGGGGVPSVGWWWGGHGNPVVLPLFWIVEKTRGGKC